MRIKQFEYNLFGVNTYVVWDDASLEAAIIDPGMVRESEQREISDFITDNHLIVKHLINTHLHIDHTLGNDYVTARYGVKAEANTDDDFLGKARDAQARMFHLPLSGLAPIEIGVPLHEGEKIWLGNEYMLVLEVPGHSPGSVVLYAPESAFVIVGDVLFRGSIGRTDLVGGDHAQLLQEIDRKLMSLPDDTVVYPGHGPETTIGLERRSNPYL